jgi:hypothetical protein
VRHLWRRLGRLAQVSSAPPAPPLILSRSNEAPHGIFATGIIAKTYRQVSASGTDIPGSGPSHRKVASATTCWLLVMDFVGTTRGAGALSDRCRIISRELWRQLLTD